MLGVGAVPRLVEDLHLGSRYLALEIGGVGRKPQRVLGAGHDQHRTADAAVVGPYRTESPRLSRGCQTSGRAGFPHPRFQAGLPALLHHVIGPPALVVKANAQDLAHLLPVAGVAGEHLAFVVVRRLAAAAHGNDRGHIEARVHGHLQAETAAEGIADEIHRAETQGSDERIDMPEPETQRVAEAVDEIGAPETGQVRRIDVKTLAELRDVVAPTELGPAAELAAVDQQYRGAAADAGLDVMGADLAHLHVVAAHALGEVDHGSLRSPKPHTCQIEHGHGRRGCPTSPLLDSRFPGCVKRPTSRCGRPIRHSRAPPVIPAKAGIQGWWRGATAAFPRSTPPGFPLSRE